MMATGGTAPSALGRSQPLIPYYAIAVFVAAMGGLSRYTNKYFMSEREKEIERGLTIKTLSATRWTIFDVLIVIALVSFSAMRFEVGSDFKMYSRFYESLYANDWVLQIQASPQEVGYTVLSLFLRQFSDSPHLIFWVTSIITVLPAYAAIKKRSADPTLSLLLYVLLAFFVSPFNVIRQGIAVSLNFWANTFIEKNKPAFIAINAVAALFHTTAIIIAVVQLIIHKWKPSAKTVVAVIAAAIIGAAGLHSFTFLGEWLNGLNERYDTYIGAKSSTAGLGTYLVLAVTLALLLYSARLGNVKANSTYFMYVLVGVAFLIVGTQAIAISRMHLYFGIFLILLVPNQMQNRAKPGLEKALLVVAAAIYFGFFLANYGGLLPYQTYMDNPQ